MSWKDCGVRVGKTGSDEEPASSSAEKYISLSRDTMEVCRPEFAVKLLLRLLDTGLKLWMEEGPEGLGTEVRDTGLWATDDLNEGLNSGGEVDELIETVRGDLEVSLSGDVISESLIKDASVDFNVSKGLLATASL